MSSTLDVASYPETFSTIFCKMSFFIWLKQPCMTFKKLYLSRRRSGTPANTKDGAIYNNKFLLNIVNYSIATMSSILGVGRGPEILWPFARILGKYHTLWKQIHFRNIICY